MSIDICPECKVPEPFNQGQVWLNNGDIVQSANPEARLGFIECENIDPLFAKIEDIIGVSIESPVINITARGTERYINNFIPSVIREMIQTKQIGLDDFIVTILSYCHIIGYGRYEFVEHRYERDDDDYSILRIEAPFSVPEAASAPYSRCLVLHQAGCGGHHSILRST